MKKFKKIAIGLVTISFLALPIFVAAQAGGTSGNPSGGTGGTSGNPGNQSPSIVINNPIKNGNTIMEVLTTLLNEVVLPIAGIVVVIWIIYAGFTFLTAQGKPAEIQKAQQRLLWSLIGAGILLGAAGIAKVVQTTITSLTT